MAASKPRDEPAHTPWFVQPVHIRDRSRTWSRPQERCGL